EVHDGRQLVTGGHGLAQDEGAVGAVEVVVQVGAADADVRDAQPHLALPGLDLRHVLPAEVLGGVDAQGLHRWISRCVADSASAAAARGPEATRVVSRSPTSTVNASCSASSADRQPLSSS